MNEKQFQSPHHNTIRTVLRVGGPIIAALGLIFTIVGFGSFFSSVGSFEPPRYFWCAFVGLPLVGVGLVMCRFGYLGSIYRYFAGEAAPLAKDAVNYMGEGGGSAGSQGCRQGRHRGHHRGSEGAAAEAIDHVQNQAVPDGTVASRCLPLGFLA